MIFDCGFVFFMQIRLCHFCRHPSNLEAVFEELRTSSEDIVPLQPIDNLIHCFSIVLSAIICNAVKNNFGVVKAVIRVTELGEAFQIWVVKSVDGWFDLLL